MGRLGLRRGRRGAHWAWGLEEMQRTGSSSEAAWRRGTEEAWRRGGLAGEVKARATGGAEVLPAASSRGGSSTAGRAAGKGRCRRSLPWWRSSSGRRSRTGGEVGVGRHGQELVTAEEERRAGREEKRGARRGSCKGAGARGRRPWEKLAGGESQPGTHRAGEEEAEEIDPRGDFRRKKETRERKGVAEIGRAHV